MNQSFGQTLRELPAEAETASHQLLLRAGAIRQHAAGIFSYLPLAWRALRRIEDIVREEMDAIGGQEILMPVIQPADLWQASGRWYKIDAELGRFKDRTGRDMVLAMTHEEVIADLARREIRSYRQLPQMLYHIQTKWRDDPRPRAGLVRVREFLMKDSYTLDADWEGLEKQYQAHIQAYFNIFHRCGLEEVIAVEADLGIMGGKLSHEFMYLTPTGEDTLLLCEACGYAANRQIARLRKPITATASVAPEAVASKAEATEDGTQEAALPIQKVATPDCKSIEDLANFLDVPKSKTAKAVFLMAEMVEEKATREQFVFAVVRGDMEVNETKLARAIGARGLRPATEAEIRAVGAEPGYASAINLSAGMVENKPVVIVDDLIPHSQNLVAGANEAGFHFLNTNYGRDYSADIITDIVAVQDGDACPECGNSLRAVRGVEVGNIFQLGTRYSETQGCFYLDRNGQKQPVIMGSYGIGLGRLLACVAEQHHDEQGLVWPVTVAPYPVHLVLLVGKGGMTGNPETAALAERLYQELSEAGVECLYDDREESPGVKFNDADLIGLPIRITVSERARQQGGVEMKRRDSLEKVVIPVDEVVMRVEAEINNMSAGLKRKAPAASVRVK